MMGPVVGTARKIRKLISNLSFIDALIGAVWSGEVGIGENQPNPIG